MIGKKGKNRKVCAICGGSLRKGRATIPFSLNDKTVIIKDVPAEICGDCGEAFVTGFVADRVDMILDRVEQLDAEVSVVHYKAA